MSRGAWSGNSALTSGQHLRCPSTRERWRAAHTHARRSQGSVANQVPTPTPTPSRACLPALLATGVQAYAKGAPIMSDEDYNALKAELKTKASVVAAEGPRCSIRSKKM